MNQNGIHNNDHAQYLNFKKASPETLQKILTAMNAELDEAIAQNRFPTLEGFHRRLDSRSSALQ